MSHASSHSDSAAGLSDTARHPPAPLTATPYVRRGSVRMAYRATFFVFHGGHRAQEPAGCGLWTPPPPWPPVGSGPVPAGRSARRGAFRMRAGARWMLRVVPTPRAGKVFDFDLTLLPPSWRGLLMQSACPGKTIVFLLGVVQFTVSWLGIVP